jgi:hypothetical protein
MASMKKRGLRGTEISAADPEFVGSLAGTVLKAKDLTEPTGETWDAERA